MLTLSPRAVSRGLSKTGAFHPLLYTVLSPLVEFRDDPHPASNLTAQYSCTKPHPHAPETLWWIGPKPGTIAQTPPSRSGPLCCPPPPKYGILSVPSFPADLSLDPAFHNLFTFFPHGSFFSFLCGMDCLVPQVDSSDV